MVNAKDSKHEFQLTDAEIDKIASLAADKAVKKMMDDAFKVVGKTVIEKTFWVIGVIALGTLTWLQITGKAPNLK